MIGYHHQLKGHEFEQTLGDSKGLESFARCSSWSRSQLDTTYQLNNNSYLYSCVFRHCICDPKPKGDD